MSPIGRNDPCPCGSGRKYKQCSAAKAVRIAPDNLAALTNPELLEAYQRFIESHDHGDGQDLPSFMEWQGKPNTASAVSHQLSAAFNNREFGSEAEFRQAAAELTAAYNHQAVPDFLGLSPDQMNRILDGAADDQAGLAALDFAAAGELASQAPLYRLAAWLLPVLAESPVKLTEAGYLPPALVVQCHEAVFVPCPFWGFDGFVPAPVKKEADLPVLGSMRAILAGLGLLKVRSKALSLTAKGRLWLAAAPAARFEILYRGISQELDWETVANPRIIEPHPLIQQSWVFLLWVLRQKAAAWVDHEDLARLWLQAFPGAADDYGIDPEQAPPPGRYFSDFDMLVDMVEWYGFQFMMRMLGLVEFEPWEKGVFRMPRLKTTQLFDALVRWA